MISPNNNARFADFQQFALRQRKYLMNAKQKLHQAKMTKWAALINQQLESGLSIREWCIQNNQSFHAYNYWKHLIKKSMVDSVIPDIVPSKSILLSTTTNPVFLPDSVFSFVQNRDFYSLFSQLP